MSLTRFHTMADRLLTRYGGDVELIRATLSEPQQPWDPPTTTTETETLRFAPAEITLEALAAGTVLQGDLLGDLETPDPDGLDQPEVGDVLKVVATGASRTVLSVEAVGPAGNPTHYRVHARA